ncbi:class I SAM-dependent methyltransferase [Krasilnikovia sp. MM14-A1259]|uniref:class I SAM-dependent methyltransferase n=1 Tax=Krasilnikovia sp. MM14-A1259 TaxID=3373539 RepID=UPI003808E288
MSKEVVALFDRVADRYDEVLPFFGELGRLCVDRLPAPGPGGRLLDIGAGRGAIAVAAHARGYAVTATDASPGMVERLRADHPEFDVRVMDAGRIDADDDTFNVVTAGFVMHLLDDPQAAVREIKRVLKPGGIFAITGPGRMPDGFEFADISHALFAEFSRYLPPGGSMGEPFDELEALAEAGFTDIDETDLRIELPVADAETFWQWFQTHGTRKFLDELDADRRAQFRARLIDDLESRDRIVLRGYAWLSRGRA